MVMVVQNWLVSVSRPQGSKRFRYEFPVNESLDVSNEINSLIFVGIGRLQALGVHSAGEMIIGQRGTELSFHDKVYTP